MGLNLAWLVLIIDKDRGRMGGRHLLNFLVSGTREERAAGERSTVTIVEGPGSRGGRPQRWVGGHGPAGRV